MTTSRDALTSAASAVKIIADSIGVVYHERGVGCGEPRAYSFHNFGASASDSRTKTKIAQQRKVCLLTIETEGRVSGGDRAILTNKGEAVMNKIMLSLFAVILAAFAMSASMRERAKAEAECHAVEAAR